jgi:deoxycytidylate deaminase
VTLDKLLVLSYLAGLDSPDPSTQNGAVLVDTIGFKGSILGTGYNHFPRGVPDSYWHGEKQDKYNRVVHAEVSAILNAAQNGNSPVNATLICGWAACSNCAKHIAESGVEKLVRHSFEQNISTTGNYWYEDCLLGDEIMKGAGIEIIEVAPVKFDIALRRDGKEWRP